MGHAFEPLSREIIAAAIEVHKTLGPGFLETIYHNALKVELRKRNLDFQSEIEVQVVYKFRKLAFIGST